jgi:hypothetical protein
MIVVDVMIKFTYSATFSCSYDDINDLFYWIVLFIKRESC